MDPKFNRVKLRASGLSDGWIDELLGEIFDFKYASIPNTDVSPTTGKNLPKHSGLVNRVGRPPLKRQMSALALANNLPPKHLATEPRRFFRTWVRAVPAATREAT